MHHFLPLAIFFLWGLICRAATIDGSGDGSRSTLRATFADDFLVGAAIDYGELRGRTNYPLFFDRNLQRKTFVDDILRDATDASRP